MPVHSTPRRRARLEAIYQSERDRIDSVIGTEAATDTRIDDLAMTSNWMYRTAWTQTFKGADRSVLLLLPEGPAPGAYCQGGIRKGLTYSNQKTRQLLT
jgi:hypothetical protein